MENDSGLPEPGTDGLTNTTGGNPHTAPQAEIAGPEALPPFMFFPFKKETTPFLLIALLAFVFYLPSVNNENALDDGTLIHQNKFVLKGAAGIKDLMTNDEYHGFFERMCASDLFRWGHYKPLPSITFAIEQQIIQPYRSGNYFMPGDVNGNGILDTGKVSFINSCGRSDEDYEVNEFTDLNYDGLPQPRECYYCWDLNKNFINESSEDLNADGVFNEVDCQVKDASFRHLNNIWLYALCCIIIYLLFSRHLLKFNQDLAFLAAFIFTIHPVNSEAVANVAGRHYILSLLFVSLTLIVMFKYYQHKSWYWLPLAAISYFLALISGENALLLLILVPLATFIFVDEKQGVWQILIIGIAFGACTVMAVRSNIQFEEDTKLVLSETVEVSRLTQLLTCLGLFVLTAIVFGLYLILKKKPGTFSVVLMIVAFTYITLHLYFTKVNFKHTDNEVLNNPFLFASGTEAFATKMAVLLKYAGLFFFPHPLVSDYSYATYNYTQLSDASCIASIIVYGLIIISAIYLCIKRHLLGFGLAWYLFYIAAFSNLAFFTGNILHEAYLFHAAIGLCIVSAWLLLGAMQKWSAATIKIKQVVLAGLLLLVTGLAAIKSWERCLDWKNDVTLFLKDVKNAPNSVLVLGNAGARWIDLADTKEITGINLPGTDTTKFNDYNGTLRISDEEVSEMGCSSKREAALKKGIAYLEHAVELHPRYVNGYLNLGLAWYKLNADEKALFYWKCAESLYPSNPYLRNYYSVYSEQLKNKGFGAFERGQLDSACVAFNKWAILTPSDPNPWYNLGAIYYKKGRFELALKSLLKAQAISPNNTELKDFITMARDAIKNKP